VTGHDEDGDGIVDACDACPVVPNEDPKNMDGDALPDACDPHPAMPGDSIGAFFPFDTMPAGFSAASGSITDWHVERDALSIDIGAMTDIIVVDVGFANQALVLGGDAISVRTDATSVLSAIIDANKDASTYVGCGLRFDTHVRELFDYDGSKPATQQFTGLDTDNTPPMVVARPYDIGVVAGATVQSCDIVDMTAHILSGPVAQRQNNFVGIRARDVNVAIDYMIVYRF
jgi:hypothetical protein